MEGYFTAHFVWSVIMGLCIWKFFDDSFHTDIIKTANYLRL